MIKIKFLILITVIALSLTGCKKRVNTDTQTFTFLKRNAYFTDTYNNITIYRNNKTKKPLNGHFVVADDFKKWEEFNVENGILNGVAIIYHDNGKIYTKSDYINGKLHGKEKTYYPNGKLNRVTSYSHGVKYGTILWYFENGALKSEAKVKDEDIIERTSYNTIGEIVLQMFIEDGKKITQHIKAGNIFREEISSTYDNFEAMKFYNEDGSLKLFLQMLIDNNNSFIIERDKNGNELKRVNIKKQPQEALKYHSFIKNGF